MTPSFCSTVWMHLRKRKTGWEAGYRYYICWLSAITCGRIHRTPCRCWRRRWSLAWSMSIRGHSSISSSQRRCFCPPICAGKKKEGEDKKYRYVKNLFCLTTNHIKDFRGKNPAGDDTAWSVGDMAAKLLSPREYKVLRLLAAERSNNEIAAELCITVRTVKYHNSRIFEKLGVKNRLEAIIRARDSGLLN